MVKAAMLEASYWTAITPSRDIVIFIGVVKPDGASKHLSRSPKVVCTSTGPPETIINYLKPQYHDLSRLKDELHNFS